MSHERFKYVIEVALNNNTSIDEQHTMDREQMLSLLVECIDASKIITVHKLSPYIQGAKQ